MIHALKLSDIAQQCDGHLVGNDASITQVSTDTRKIKSGDLFVALRGENFDAHDFLAAAVDQGAQALVVDAVNDDINVPQVVVADTTKALGCLGQMVRCQFTGKLVAITGSSGKTTVKEMLASILRQMGTVHATQGNLNNHIGVPLTLLELATADDYAVIEMGASGPNEIAYLTQLGEPEVALVNNAMAAHLEGFGSLAGVASAKGEIYQGLQAHGTAVLNADDDFFEQWQSGLREDVKALTFSVQKTSDLTASNVYAGDKGCSAFDLKSPAGACRVQLSLLGEQNVANALAAAACAYAVGADLNAIKLGLEDLKAVAGRLQVLDGKRQSLIINDSYNANPGSVKAAINTLMQLTEHTNHILVLGDLGELGEGAEGLLRELGTYAKQAGLQKLITTGTNSRYVSEGFGEGSQHFEQQWDAIEQLQQQVDKDTVVLIKGSRSARMEVVVQALTQSGELS